MDGNELECGCGNIGCMARLAGGRYLAHLRQTVYKDTHISEMFSKHGEEPLLRQFIDRMAMTVATEVNILDPNYILIGGGAPAMVDFPKDNLMERIQFHARKPCPANDLNIIFTEDEMKKSVIGAGVYCRNRF